MADELVEPAATRLAEIQERLELASAGPWLTPAQAGDPYEVHIIDHEGCPVWPWNEEADMVFAYAAREDIPYLLARLSEVEERLVPNRVALEEIRRVCFEIDSMRGDGEDSEYADAVTDLVMGVELADGAMSRSINGIAYNALFHSASAERSTGGEDR